MFTVKGIQNAEVEIVVRRQQKDGAKKVVHKEVMRTKQSFFDRIKNLFRKLG